MGYADHIRASAQRPNCWGNSRSYSPHDIECAECTFRNSCRAQIDREGEGGMRVPVRTSNAPYYRRRDNDADDASYEAGQVGQGERAIERFAKDAVAGALRGMFHEMWQFWKNFRIP